MDLLCHRHSEVTYNRSMVRLSDLEFIGDVNQDQTVDAGDISLIENDAVNSVFGYVLTDINGDDASDASDISLVENNAGNSVSDVTP